MPRLFVVADDLTGAAEIGGIALLYGLTARILLEPDKNESYREQVIILDTNSRSLGPEMAYNRVTELLSDFSLDDFDLVYKKVDSVLRGPLIYEIKAIAEYLKPDNICLVPSNPSKNRIIRSGKYYIGPKPLNETGFRFDPGYPRLSANVADLVEGGRGVVISGHSFGDHTRQKIIVPDIKTPDDMRSFIAELPDSGVLLSGASDFFGGILTYRMGLERKFDYAPLDQQDHDHFIIGSKSERTRSTKDFLKGLNYRLFEMPLNALDNDCNFAVWIDMIRQALKKGEKVIVSGPGEFIRTAKMKSQITMLLACAAKEVCSLLPSRSRLFIEGGETSSSVFRSAGWNNVLIDNVYDGGVVSLKTGEPGKVVIIKPGSYNWPGYLAK